VRFGDAASRVLEIRGEMSGREAKMTGLARPEGAESMEFECWSAERTGMGREKVVVVL